MAAMDVPTLETCQRGELPMGQVGGAAGILLIDFPSGETRT